MALFYFILQHLLPDFYLFEDCSNIFSLAHYVPTIISYHLIVSPLDPTAYIFTHIFIIPAPIPKKLPSHHFRRSPVIPLLQIPLRNRPKHSLNHIILNITICLHFPGQSHYHIFYWLVIQQLMQLRQ